MKILVTGSEGHLGSYIIPILEREGHTVNRLDLPLSVTSVDDLRNFEDSDVCIHLAGLKYADRAELAPVQTVDVNVLGTWNVCEVFGNRVITASTCKAADPETVYGASKLIAERITLSAGGKVIRLVNVLGSVGSVTEIWGQIPPGDPLPVCDASRLFMSRETAGQLFIDAIGWPAGRYATTASTQMLMDEVAEKLYPGRATTRIPLRRGDRRCERLLAACEVSTPFGPDVIRIEGLHDPDPTLRQALAETTEGW